MLRRLIVCPEPDEAMRPNRHVRFLATLENTGEFVVRSHQPLVDGARELLARGFDPATLLTMRHEGKAYDSFRPAPIGELAKWTYSESEAHPLRRRAWVPRETPVAADREGQKSGADGEGVPDLPAGPEIDSTTARVGGTEGRTMAALAGPEFA
jgi:hypothetical protein